MPTFDVDREPINVFAVYDRYLFKHYFERDVVFAALCQYYNEDDYRFEVPQDAVDDLREILEEHFYEPVMIRGLESFCVVYPKYSEHPSVLFKASILQRSKGEQHVFLMKDQVSVEKAINRRQPRWIKPRLIPLVRSGRAEHANGRDVFALRFFVCWSLIVD